MAVRSLSTLRARMRADEGFSLIEAVVALLVLGIVSSGFTYTMTLTLRVTRDDRLRQQATHLAEREIEITRNQFAHADTVGQAAILASGTKVNQAPLPGGTAGQDLVIDGRAFHVVRSHEIQLNGEGQSACDGGGIVDYLTIAVDVEVSWSDSGQSHTVQSQTLLTPVKGVEGDVGYLAAKLVGAAGTGTDHVSVVATGPGGSQTRTTAADGCAVFMFSAAGTYTIAVNQTGFVNSEGFQAASKTAALEIGKLKVLPLSYDEAGSLRVSYETESGYTLPSPLPVLTVFNSGLVSGERQVGAGSNPTVAEGLWPFSDGYSVWAGSCDQSDPARSSNPRPVSIVAGPGQVADTSVYLAPLVVHTVHLIGGVPVPIAGISLTATAIDTSGCATGESVLNIGTTDATGQLAFALPGGSWQIQPATPFACDSEADQSNCPGNTGLVVVTDSVGGRPDGTPIVMPDLVVTP